jgi:hypothetical protein
LLFTATHCSGVAHETDTVARYPPGKTGTGFDQRPWCQLAADPLRPMAVHDEADAHDTDRARLVMKSGTDRGADQRCPSKIA